MAIDLDAHAFFEGYGPGLMRGLIEHGSESEELTRRRFVDDYLLLIFIDGGDANRAGDEDVGSIPGIADLIDSLARREVPKLYLGGENGGFLIVQERK